MLVLSRKRKQSFRIGKDVTVWIIRIRGDQVQLGIDAPPDVRVVRSELPQLDDVTTENTENTEQLAPTTDH